MMAGFEPASFGVINDRSAKSLCLLQKWADKLVITKQIKVRTVPPRPPLFKGH